MSRSFRVRGVAGGREAELVVMAYVVVGAETGVSMVMEPKCVAKTYGVPPAAGAAVMWKRGRVAVGGTPGHDAWYSVLVRDGA